MKRALFALLLIGCPRPCPAQPYVDPAAALASYSDMRQPVRVIRAEARVDRRDSEGRVRGTVLMFIERPNRVRFDVMTQFGPAAILTSDGESFALTDMRENRFIRGQACPANIERLLGIRLSGEEVTRLLFGDAPRIEASDESMRCENGSYLITRRASDGTVQEIALEVRSEDLAAAPEDQRMRLRRSEVHLPNGELAWRVTYDDYRFLASPGAEGGRGVVMPYEVRFEDPRRGIDTLMRFEDIDLNVEPPPDAFAQEPRPGLETEEASCD
jgi:hypothetical protein